VFDPALSIVREVPKTVLRQDVEFLAAHFIVLKFLCAIYAYYLGVPKAYKR